MRSIQIHVKNLNQQTAPRFEAVAAALNGVTRVDTWHGRAELAVEDRTDVTAVTNALIAAGFTVREQPAAAVCETPVRSRPRFFELLGIFAILLVVGTLLSKLGLFRTTFSVGSSVSFLSAFTIGLVAAASTCIAVTSGLLLSTTAKFNERFGTKTLALRMAPVGMFVAGRVASYALFGALIGAIGKALTLSPVVYAALTIVAALVMLALGLDMLHILPNWAKKLMPRMPMFLARRIMRKEGSVNPAAPFALGALTFFLPCGFTQALQLYALTTGSALRSGVILLAFALGTAPSLLALGWVSNALKGHAGRVFFKFAGAAVVILGLMNMQNGLTIAGYPITLPRFSAPTAQALSSDPNVTFDGSVQTVRMGVGPGGYSPARFTIRAGVPTRWIVDGTNAAGCQTVLVSRQLGVQKLLARGDNVIEFTAPTPGVYQFSCSMGMYRGTFTAVSS
jgi:sulfite exporter TauE/SafE